MLIPLTTLQKVNVLIDWLGKIPLRIVSGCFFPVPFAQMLKAQDWSDSKGRRSSKSLVGTNLSGDPRGFGTASPPPQIWEERTIDQNIKDLAYLYPKSHNEVVQDEG